MRSFAKKKTFSEFPMRAALSGPAKTAHLFFCQHSCENSIFRTGQQIVRASHRRTNNGVPIFLCFCVLFLFLFFFPNLFFHFQVNFSYIIYFINIKFSKRSDIKKNQIIENAQNSKILLQFQEYLELEKSFSFFQKLLLFLKIVRDF